MKEPTIWWWTERLMIERPETEDSWGYIHLPEYEAMKESLEAELAAMKKEMKNAVTSEKIEATCTRCFKQDVTRHRDSTHQWYTCRCGFQSIPTGRPDSQDEPQGAKAQ